MKVRKIFALALSLSISLSNVNIVFATKDAAYNNYIATRDIITSDSAINFEKINLLSTDSELISYPVEGGNIYFDISSGMVTDCDKSVTSATIPEKISGYNVVGIKKSYSEGAFQNCTNLKSIYLPSTIETIYPYSFSGCSELENVYLSEGLKSISSYAFTSCTSLKTINLPSSLETVSTYAFSYCTSLESINLPIGVVSYKTSNNSKPLGALFAKCTSLKEIEIPDGTTILDNYLFDNCTSLSKVIIPKSVTSIKDYAFCKCNNFTIYCYEDSYAFEYAKSNNINYVLIKEKSTLSMNSTAQYMVGTTTTEINGLCATISPHISDKSAITWTSSNPDVAQIVDTSYIDGTSSDSLLCNLNCKSEGTCTITVTADGTMASCIVTVVKEQEETKKELTEYELSILENMANIYHSIYFKYLMTDSNFNHVLYMVENDSTMHITVDAVGKGIYAGTDGIKDLLNSTTSIEDAEDILIGFLEENDEEIKALAYAKTANTVFDIINDSLKSYIQTATLSTDEMNAVSKVLDSKKLNKVFETNGFDGLMEYISKTLKSDGVSEDSDVMKVLNGFSKSDNLQKNLTKGLDIVDTGLKVVDLSKMTIDNYTDYLALQEADDIYLEILQYIEDNAHFDVLKTAAKNIRVRATQNIEEASNDIYLKLIEESTDVIAEEIWDKAIEKVWFLEVAKSGKDLGVNISNLVFHTSDSLELKDSMRNLTYIGLALEEYINSNAINYLDNIDDEISAENYSEKVIYATKMLYKTRTLGEECFEKFCKANYIKKWNETIRASKSCLEITNNQLFGDNGIITVFNTLIVSCPVDVEVYDSSNKKILTVYDGTETSGETNDIIYNVIYNDDTDDYTKIINLPEGKGYFIKAVGKDLGSVNCIVLSMDDETGLVGYKGSYNIAIDKDTTITSSSIDDKDNITLLVESNNNSYNLNLNDAFNTNYVELTDIGFDSSIKTLHKGDVEKLSFNYKPLNATNPIVYWSSSDENIVKVNSDGVISAVGVGNATITIKSFDENSTANIKITVLNYDGTENFIYGDINGDGKVTAVDAMLIAQLASGKRTDEDMYNKADLNNDSKVTAIDAMLVARYASGKITSF